MCFDGQALLFRYPHFWISEFQKDFENRLSGWFKNTRKTEMFQMAAQGLYCFACFRWVCVGQCYCLPNWFLDFQQLHMILKTALRIWFQQCMPLGACTAAVRAVNHAPIAGSKFQFS